jgi:hypothetical protein
MKQIVRGIVVIITCAALLGCDEEVDISSFSVQGTSRNENGVAPINAGVNNGAFLVTWNVAVSSGDVFDSSDRGYSISLYLSDDSELSNTSSANIRFYIENCGTSDSADNCNDDAEGSIRCNFTNDNKIVCGEGTSEGQQEISISEWLDEIPKSAFLFMEACYEGSETCDTRSVRVVFR